MQTCWCFRLSTEELVLSGAPGRPSTPPATIPTMNPTGRGGARLVASARPTMPPAARLT